MVVQNHDATHLPTAELIHLHVALLVYCLSALTQQAPAMDSVDAEQLMLAWPARLNLLKACRQRAVLHAAAYTRMCRMQCGTVEHCILVQRHAVHIH